MREQELIALLEVAPKEQRTELLQTYIQRYGSLSYASGEAVRRKIHDLEYKLKHTTGELERTKKELELATRGVKIVRHIKFDVDAFRNKYRLCVYKNKDKNGKPIWRPFANCDTLEEIIQTIDEMIEDLIEVKEKLK